MIQIKFGVFTGLVAVSAGSAWACSCLAPPPPKEALATARAVFSGRVVALEKSGNGLLATLEVSQHWKGRPGKKVVIYTANTSAACGYPFKPNEAYLVYAYRSQKRQGAPATLSTNLCTRTCLLNDAKDDLNELGPSEANP